MDVIINGTRWVPADAGRNPAVGVGVTTHNRRDVALDCIAKIKKLTPDALVVVVDDGSTEPYPDADHRFETPVGIARAKNRCLELLADAGAEHLFLFDDDAYPLVDGWWQPYVDSPEPHLMRIFPDLTGPKKLNDIAEVYRDTQHVAYTGPRGVMIYAHRSVLDTVGGMDPAFGRWGWEHGDWSNRIHAAGMTTWRFGDVVNSAELVYSLDEHVEVRRSVELAERRQLEKPNSQRYHAQKNTPAYREYRTERDVVLTCLLTSVTDPQRGRRMSPDLAALDVLLKSVTSPAVVFHDELEAVDGPARTFVKVDPVPGLNPYFARWLHFWRYLRDHPEIRYVWCVDGTDVEQLHEPALEPGRLYLGYEPTVVGCEWMRTHHRAAVVTEFIDANADRTLLNAGVVGGHRDVVMPFLHDLIRAYWDNAADRFHRIDTQTLGVGDMGIFNQVAWTRYADRIVYGPRVTTVFKANDRNDYSWWRHK